MKNQNAYKREIERMDNVVTSHLNYVQRDVRRGFTLIELLVVVLIIGILASIALPQYQKAVEKSRMSEAWTILQSIQSAQDRKRLEEGSTSNYPLGELDIEFTGANGAKATGWDLDTNNYRYSFVNSFNGFSNLDFAVPIARRRNSNLSYKLMIVGGKKYCFGADCNKVGFSKAGTSCVTGGGSYETSDCYVE